MPSQKGNNLTSMSRHPREITPSVANLLVTIEREHSFPSISVLMQCLCGISWSQWASRIIVPPALGPTLATSSRNLLCHISYLILHWLIRVRSQRPTDPLIVALSLSRT